MTRRLVGRDPDTGMAVWHEYDELADATTIAHEQDCAAYLEANKALANAEDRGFVSGARELRRAASIPNAVVLKWLVEEGIDVMNPDHWPAVRRKLNDPEWRHLRTAPGRL